MRRLDAAVHAHWLTLCYMGAAQLVCLRNALDPQALRLDDLKPRIVGHWGALPGVAYALALATACPPCRVILGTGHASAVVRAELWLRGLVPGMARGRAGADELCRTYGAPGGSITELDASWPGVCWTGGELGPALAIAAGAAIDRRDPIVVVTGDGEIETGVAAAGALSIRELTGAAPVRLCWVINRNGWRMGSRSRLGAMNPSAIARCLGIMGWRTWIARGNPAEDLEKMAAALGVASDGTPSVVVLVTEKGWTAPEQLGGRAFRGSADGHKLPVRRDDIDERVLREIVEWLKSYDPSALFDTGGLPMGELARALQNPCVLDALSADEAEITVRESGEPRQLVSARDYGDGEECPPIEGVVDILAGMRGPFLVTSPDELASNRAGRLRNKPEILVVETLSEEVCAAWLWGWTRSGRRGVMITYEAFAPLVASQLVQYGKLMAAGRQDQLPSFVVIQTSLGWHNTPSHANPDLAAVVSARRWPFARLWFPLDFHDAACVTSRAVRAHGTIEILVVSKHPMPRRADARAVDLPMVPYDQVATRGDRRSSRESHAQSVPVLAVGDLALREACAAAQLVAMAGVETAVIAVRELTALGAPEERPHAVPHARFAALTGDLPGVAVTTTTPAPVAALLAERRAGDRFSVLGYIEGTASTPLGTLLANHCDRWTIARTIIELAPSRATLASGRDTWIRRWEHEREVLWQASIERGDDMPLPETGQWIVRE